MSNAPKILAFAGSARNDSFNKKLVRIAADGARAAGSDVSVVDLRDYPMPLFDGDLEAVQGLPDGARQFKALMMQHDGFLISAPEYNSSITPLLKNTIDWVSRPAPNEPPLAAFTGKAAVLMSASPGALGGLRGLVHVRSILGNIGVLLLPDQIAVAKAADAFAPDGTLKDSKQHAGIQDLGAKLARLIAKLKS